MPKSKRRTTKRAPTAGSPAGGTAGSTAEGADGAAPKPPKAQKSSGRTTPKGSSRYTPPTPKTVVKSPLWVPVLMFTLFAVGVLVVVTNYLGLLPGEQQNWYLLLGLAQITGGFVVATFYR